MRLTAFASSEVLREKLDDMSAASGVSRSEIIRGLLEAHGRLDPIVRTFIDTAAGTLGVSGAAVLESIALAYAAKHAAAEYCGVELNPAEIAFRVDDRGKLITGSRLFHDHLERYVRRMVPDREKADGILEQMKADRAEAVWEMGKS